LRGAAEFPDDAGEINHLRQVDTSGTGAKQRFCLHFPVEQGNLADVHAHARDWLSQGFPHSFVG
jgi:hypothetical protein